MATVLFFASTGMNLTTVLERKRRDDLRLAANALFLIFAGFADNYIQGTMWKADVFQSAGMAILAMLVLRRLFPLRWTWLFPLPYLLHLANQHLYWKVAEGGVSSFFLTPGLFPLLPWLSFYLLGAHLKKYAGGMQGWLLGAGALVLLVARTPFASFQFDKFWMSADYFLIGVAVVCWAFSGLREWMSEATAEKMREIRLWGANSLVFYMTNNFVVRMLEMFIPHGVALLVISIAVTALLMRPILGLQAWTGRREAAPILLGGVGIAALVFAVNVYLWPQSYYACTLASFGLAFAFVASHPAWKNFTRSLQQRTRAARINYPPAQALAAD
ncbi:MAG: hypothetical protein ACRD3E_08505, partial [Terriglobales bacterium]